ncbi:MAG: hypothetical protein KA792_05340 [Bacteroidales bacterium]|nr:hypothetical protein [Bacteroidales bacterium]
MDFLKKIIQINSDNNKDVYMISDIILKLFDTWTNFEDVLNKQDETKWTYLQEFKVFFVELKNAEFKRNIEYDFKVIPVKKV